MPGRCSRCFFHSVLPLAPASTLLSVPSSPFRAGHQTTGNRTGSPANPSPPKPDRSSEAQNENTQRGAALPAYPSIPTVPAGRLLRRTLAVVHCCVPECFQVFDFLNVRWCESCFLDLSVLNRVGDRFRELLSGWHTRCRFRPRGNEIQPESRV